MATLRTVFKLFDGYSSTISTIEQKTTKATNKILEASGATDKFNKKLEATGASASKGIGGLGKFVSLAALAAGAVKGMQISDEFINTAARLDLINDGLQTQAELQDKIFQSAERSRGSYTEMAAAVSKMGLLAGVGEGKVFGSNDELIGFTELLQKSFKISGADTSEQQGAMRQLTQAMASGRLQGDELVSIMENAPMVYDAIAKYMGLSKGELKKLSSEGAITADIVKNAMFDAGGDINQMFENMPKTFADIWTEIKNNALKAFEPVIQKVNKLINSPTFGAVISTLSSGINVIAAAVSYLIDGFSWLIDTIYSGWATIQPILIAVGSALLLWGATQIPLLITKLWAMVAPVLEQAAGWLAINWPILLVGAAIGLLLYAMLKFGDTVVEVIGVVGGIFGGLITFLYNAVAYLVNPWISFAEFFANVFNDPVYSIKKLFVDLATNVLNLVQSIASAIDNVLGTSMSDSLQNLKDTMQDWLGEKPEDYKEFTKMQMVDIADGVNFGYNTGKKAGQWAVDGVQGIADKLGGLFGATTDKGTGTASFDWTNDALNVQGTESNGAIEVEMSDEDIQYLRDIAQRDYINKFSTATLAPNIQVSFGDVHEEADANKVAGRIKQILQDEIATAAEGVYT